VQQRVACHSSLLAALCPLLSHTIPPLSFVCSLFPLFSVGIVALVMLLLTILLTVVLLKKLRYLSREDGNVYGQLQPSGTTDSAAGTI
jgi:hypothetical protein